MLSAPVIMKNALIVRERVMVAFMTATLLFVLVFLRDWKIPMAVISVWTIQDAMAPEIVLLLEIILVQGIV